MGETWELTRGQVAWMLAGLLLTLVVAYVLCSFIGAIVVGVFLYYAVRPVSRWLDQRTDYPSLNATATLLIVGIPILLILGYSGLVAVRELDQLFRQTGLQQFRTSLQPYLDLAQLTETTRLVTLLRSNAGSLLGYANAVFTWLLRLFVIVVVAYYLLRDDKRIAAWFRSTFEGTPGVVTFMNDVDSDLTTIYTGNLIIIGITGAIAALTYYGLDLVAPESTGVAFPLLLGLLTGVFTIIPVFGIKLIYFPYTAYLGFQAVRGEAVPLWYPVLFFVVTLVVIDAIPDFFIRSYVSKGDLHMGLVLFAYVLGSIAFGWYGIFLGPIVLVLFIHFLRNILPNLVQGRQVQVNQD